MFHATGTKLNRDVAIKVLSPAFAQDAARMQCFEREAQLLASLQPSEHRRHLRLVEVRVSFQRESRL